MSSVIQPANIALIAPQSAQPSLSSDGIEAAISFQALLDPATPIVGVEKSPAVSFDHLGMFGVHAGQSYADGTEIEPLADTPIEAVASASIPDQLPPSESTASQYLQPFTNVAQAREASLVPALPGRDAIASAMGSQVVAQPIAVSPRTPSETEFPVNNDRSAGQNPLRNRPISHAAPTLVVGGDGNLVSIAARGWSGGEDGLRLRRRMQAVAAEFGVGISEFYLDGASITPLASRQEA
jgi:hypothetical protein